MRKLKNLLIMFLVLSATATLAQIIDYGRCKVVDKYILIKHDKKLEFTASENCFSVKKRCLGFKKLKMASLKGLKSFFVGGANRGAVACRHKLAGTLVMCVEKDGSETSFCRFKDNSYISSDTIEYYAKKNDMK